MNLGQLSGTVTHILDFPDCFLIILFWEQPYAMSLLQVVTRQKKLPVEEYSQQKKAALTGALCGKKERRENRNAQVYITKISSDRIAQD